MSSLHILNSLNPDPWKHCQTLCQCGDALVLYADGVALALQKDTLNTLSKKGVQCYALQEDCTARGLALEEYPITLIDYDAWVKLSSEHQNCSNWS